MLDAFVRVQYANFSVSPTMREDLRRRFAASSRTFAMFFLIQIRICFIIR